MFTCKTCGEQAGFTTGAPTQVVFCSCYTDTLTDERDRLTAERDELKRRLDAVVKSLRPLPKGDPSPYWKTYCDECGWFGLSSSCVVTYDEDHECLCPNCGFGIEEMHAGYESQIEARYDRTLAIAEGRDNG